MKNDLNSGDNQLIFQHEELEKKYSEIKSLDTRSRIKALKAFGFHIISQYNNNRLNESALLTCIKIMNDVINHHSFPQRYTKFLTSTLVPDWLEATGNHNVTIINKVSSKVSVDSGSLAIADMDELEISKVIDDYSEKNYIRLMNEHKWFVFSTASDGLFNVQIRVIDSSEPVLKPKEYRWVVDASMTATIYTSSGMITIGDPFALDADKHCIKVNVQPGFYNITVFDYRIPNKLASYYILLSNLANHKPKQITKIYQFSNL